MHVIESEWNDCRIECMSWEILDREDWVQRAASESHLTSSSPPGFSPETLPTHPHWADKTIVRRFDALLSLLGNRRAMPIEEVGELSLFEGLYATLLTLGRGAHHTLMIRIQPSPGAEQPSLFLSAMWTSVSTATSWVIHGMRYSEWIRTPGVVPWEEGKLVSSQSEFHVKERFGLLSEEWALGGERGSESLDYQMAKFRLKIWSEMISKGFDW